MKKTSFVVDIQAIKFKIFFDAFALAVRCLGETNCQRIVIFKLDFINQLT
jgi:hypothetical protein